MIGDIPPENQLNSRDIRATGATSISELLEAIAPQIGSARGRGGEAPVLLLNGRRISGFRELRDIPPEAIERVDILPEEVALKYGYRADQRVVNFVLRRRFLSTADARRRDAGDRGRLWRRPRRPHPPDHQPRQPHDLQPARRGQWSADEDERDIALQDPDGFDTRPFRSLVGSRRLARGSATVSRTILGDVAATLNGEVEHSEGRSGLGFEDIPLLRDSSSDSAHLGLSLNQDRGRWKTSLTGNADWVRSVTTSDRDADTTDRARTTQTSGDLTGVFSGPISNCRRADANAHRQAGGRHARPRHQPAPQRRQRLERARPATGCDGSLNLDVPLLREGPLGKLGANANAEVEHFSDFGTLTTLGAGLNWSPAPSGSTSSPAGPARKARPRVQQLGDPILETPDTQHLRLHHRRDGAGHHHHRRQPRPRRRPPQRVQARRQLEAVRGQRPSPACRICPFRRSTDPVSSFPGPARRWRRLSPIASCAMARATSLPSTCGRSISRNRAATRCAGASTFHQAAQVGPADRRGADRPMRARFGRPARPAARRHRRRPRARERGDRAGDRASRGGGRRRRVSSAAGAERGG